MVTPFGQKIPLLERSLGGTSSNVVLTSLERNNVTLTNTHIFTFEEDMFTKFWQQVQLLERSTFPVGTPPQIKMTPLFD